MLFLHFCLSFVKPLLLTQIAGALQNTFNTQIAGRLAKCVYSWLDYNNINIFGKSLFQPEYHILKKAFVEKLPKEVIIRLFENQNEITDLGVSPISFVEKMAKNIEKEI